MILNSCSKANCGWLPLCSQHSELWLQGQICFVWAPNAKKVGLSPSHQARPHHIRQIYKISWRHSRRTPNAITIIVAYKISGKNRASKLCGNRLVEAAVVTARSELICLQLAYRISQAALHVDIQTVYWVENLKCTYPAFVCIYDAKIWMVPFFF